MLLDDEEKGIVTHLIVGIIYTQLVTASPLNLCSLLAELLNGTL